MHEADEKQLPAGRSWRILRSIVKLFRNSISSRAERVLKTENSICPKDRNYKYFCDCCHKWKFQLNTLLIFIVHPKSLICSLLSAYFVFLFVFIFSFLLFLQMVATDEQTSERQQHATDSGGGGASNTGALNKMKATLSSSLLTVTDKGE